MKKIIVALFVVGSAFTALTMKLICLCNQGNEPPKMVYPPAKLETSPSAEHASTRPSPADPQPFTPSATTPSVGHESSTPSSTRVVAYYFHRTVRCHTCLAIEDLSRQTIENMFTEEFAEGRVEWRPVNIEEKGNEHFENDYKLTTQSLVFVKLTDGKQADWKNLTSVWELIDNQGKFIKYVQEELTKYLRS